MVDAALTIKTFVQESLDAGDVIALISLDVQGAFDAALWLGVLREMKESKCPKNSITSQGAISLSALQQ
jgi:hypothetical protein